MDITVFIVIKDPNVVTTVVWSHMWMTILKQTISASEMNPWFGKIYLYKTKELATQEI